MEGFSSAHRTDESARAGTVLKGRYEIQETLGISHVARTYLANDRYTRRPVVVKELSMKTLEDWKTLELFERESSVLSNLEHPQIPDWIDFFHERLDTETRVYLVQEYIPGKSLKDLVGSGKHFTEAQVIQIGIDICKILEYLHGFSPEIIHRDIKPGNVLIDPEGQVHLIDFGAVRDKLLNREAGGTHTVVGTYGYMPFEQYQGRAVPASDIYSLAVTLVYLLSHKEPHELEDFGSKLRFEQEVNISKAFEQVLSRALEPDWQKRYLSAAEFRKDLEAALAGKSPSRTGKIPVRRLVVGATLAMALLGAIVFWTYRPEPARTTVPVTVERSLTSSHSRVVAEGSLYYDGRPMTDFTQASPRFWFRNEDTGTVATADVTYENGIFQIRGLQPGSYGISVTVDRNPENGINYPGDFNTWESFSVGDSGITSLALELKEIIHVQTPQDNGKVMEHWGADYDDMVVHPRQVTFRWKGLGEDVYYDYTISRVKYPYDILTAVESGTTKETSLRVNLPANRKGEYYLFKILARKNGRLIGMFITHGANGMGWDYRFRIE